MGNVEGNANRYKTKVGTLFIVASDRKNLIWLLKLAHIHPNNAHIQDLKLNFDSL